MHIYLGVWVRQVHSVLHILRRVYGMDGVQRSSCDSSVPVATPHCHVTEAPPTRGGAYFLVPLLNLVRPLTYFYQQNVPKGQ